MALSDNLVAYWSLDEASGNAIDAHTGNDLTDTNTVGAGTGVVSGCRDFERDSSEYFTINDNTDLSTGDIDFTITAWVNLESKPAGNQVIVAKDSGSNGEYYLYRKNTDDIFTFDVYGATGFGSNGRVTATTGGATPSTATWYFLVAWHDSVNNQVGISVNGGAADTVAHSAGVIDGTGTFRIGNDSFSDFWDGLIDEVGFWKRVLTGAERTELYNSGAGRSYAYITGAGQPANTATVFLLVA